VTVIGTVITTLEHRISKLAKMSQKHTLQQISAKSNYRL
jgi:hypothetical protein